MKHRIIPAVATVVLAMTATGCAASNTAPAPSASSASVSGSGLGVAARATTGAPSPSSRKPDGGSYVSLGDSYAAAYGVKPADPASPRGCARSANDLGHLVAARGGYRLTDVACSGARTADLSRNQPGTGAHAQAAALGPGTRLVTLMIGGNDSSVFGRAVGQCSKLGFEADGAGSPCRTTYGAEFTSTITKVTYPALVTAFRTARAKAPNARIVAVGYPRLLPASGGCYPTMPLGAGDVAYLDGIERALNDAVSRAARVTGVTYVDAYAASTGHDACAKPESRWVEPVLGGTGMAAHPNARGVAALADLTLAALHRN